MSRFFDGMSFRLFSLVVLLLATGPVCRCAEDRTRDPRLWERLRPYTVPPAEYAEDFGSYDSPLRSADGTTVPTPEQWQRRRAELLAMWHQRLGPWPPLVEKPDVKRLESTPQDGYVEHHVHVQISPEGKVADGYLLIPAGTGPFRPFSFLSMNR